MTESIRPVTDFWSRYTKIEKIGQGSFGIVFLVKHNATQRWYAVKFLSSKLDIRDDSEYLIYKYIAECSAGMDDHPGYDRLLQAYSRQILRDDTQTFAVIVMSYARGVILDKCRFTYHPSPELDYSQLPMSSLNVIALQLFQAVDYLHQIRVAHRDIKPSNMIWNAKTQQLKLIDLGNCCIGNPPSKYKIYSVAEATIGITRSFACPDVLRVYHREDTDRSLKLFMQGDIWSACFSLITMMHPHSFPRHWYKDIKQRVADGEYSDWYAPLENSLQNLVTRVNSLGKILLLGFARNGARPSAHEMVVKITRLLASS